MQVFHRCHPLRFPSESCHVTSLCRSVWSAVTAAFTCFHWDQKHFHIFFATFWEDLWPFTDLSQPHHLRCAQNPTQFLLHLLDTQLPHDSASVSIMKSSACLSELSSHALPCHTEDACLRYLLLHGSSQATGAPFAGGSKWLPDHACHGSCSYKQ